MIDILIITVFIIIFGLIIYKRIKPSSSTCSTACSSCPIVKQCNKDMVLEDMRQFIKQS
ncbi:MAG: hypothetical protein ACOC1L_02810 [Bacillota bacterium]